MLDHQTCTNRQRRALAWPRVVAILAVVFAPTFGLAQETAPQIPLVVGLTTVSVINDNGIDYEVFRTVVAADANAVTFALRRPDVQDNSGVLQEPVAVRSVVERLDLAEANRVITFFHSEDPESFPGARRRADAGHGIG